MFVWDIAAVRGLNALAAGSPAAEFAAIAAAESAVFLMVGLFCAVAARQIIKRRHMDDVRFLVRAAAASLAGLALKRLIGLIWFRPRPFVTHADLVNLIAMTPAEQSFPSGHATVAFAVAFAGADDRRLFAFLLLFAVIVGFGRMAVGVHYPSDILGGLLSGFLWARIAVHIDGTTAAHRFWTRSATALGLKI